MILARQLTPGSLCDDQVPGLNPFGVLNDEIRILRDELAREVDNFADGRHFANRKLGLRAGTQPRKRSDNWIATRCKPMIRAGKLTDLLPGSTCRLRVVAQTDISLLCEVDTVTIGPAIDRFAEVQSLTQDSVPVLDGRAVECVQCWVLGGVGIPGLCLLDVLSQLVLLDRRAYQQLELPVLLVQALYKLVALGNLLQITISGSARELVPANDRLCRTLR